MNLSIDLYNLSLVNINFLDTKKNIIMDGNFTKIIYSNNWFTINSIFIHFPIEWLSIDKIANKSILRFNPYSAKNLPIVQDFAKFETRILEYFKTFCKLNIRTTNTFSKQLYTGNMKIFKEYVDPNKISYDDGSSFYGGKPMLNGGLSEPFGIEKSRYSMDVTKRSLVKSLRIDEDESQKLFVIKISGIWENYEEIGLTFKLMEQGSMVKAPMANSVEI